VNGPLKGRAADVPTRAFVNAAEPAKPASQGVRDRWAPCRRGSRPVRPIVQLTGLAGVPGAQRGPPCDGQRDLAGPSTVAGSRARPIWQSRAGAGPPFWASARCGRRPWPPFQHLGRLLPPSRGGVHQPGRAFIAGVAQWTLTARLCLAACYRQAGYPVCRCQWVAQPDDLSDRQASGLARNGRGRCARI